MRQVGVQFINRLFKAVGEPAVPQHGHHRRRGALEVFKGVHQDEVQHNVEEVHTHHLQGSEGLKRCCLTQRLSFH